MKKFLFILNQKEGQFSIPLDDILFLKADSRYTKIITREKTYLSCKTLKLYHEELEEAHFFYRLDRSHLININNLSIISGNKLYFNDKDISCSDIKIRELRKYLNNKQMSESNIIQYDFRILQCIIDIIHYKVAFYLELQNPSCIFSH